MNLIYPKYELNISLNPDTPVVLAIENPSDYTNFLDSIIHQSYGETGDLRLLDRDDETKFSKEVCVILNPLVVDCNEKKILSKLYAQLADISDEQFTEEQGKINSQAVAFIDQLMKEVPYHLEMSLNLSVPDLLKMYEVKLDYSGTTLLERIVDYIRVQHQILRTSIFVFIGLKEYLICEELHDLYTMCQYEQVSLVIIEGRSYNVLSEEKTIIIDHDRCIINI